MKSSILWDLSIGGRLTFCYRSMPLRTPPLMPQMSPLLLGLSNLGKQNCEQWFFLDTNDQIALISLHHFPPSYSHYLAAWTPPPLQRGKQFFCNPVRPPLHGNRSLRRTQNPSRCRFRPDRKTPPGLKTDFDVAQQIISTTLWQLFLVPGSWVEQMSGASVKDPRAAPHLGMAQSDGTSLCGKICGDGFVRMLQE